MSTPARICAVLDYGICLTAFLAVLIIAIGCTDSNPLEATVDSETLTQPTEQERRIYDPVRIEHWEKVKILDDAICFVVSTGAIIGNTHEWITIIQSQMVNQSATGGEKVILWASIVEAYRLENSEMIERPPE